MTAKVVSPSNPVKTTLMRVKAALAATLVKALHVATSVAAKILVNPRAPAALTTVHLHVVLARRLKQVARLLTRRHVQLASLLVALTPKSVLLSHAHRVNFQRC
jgi:hypothetical protein